MNDMRYTIFPFASVAEGIKLYNGIVVAERTLGPIGRSILQL